MRARSRVRASLAAVAAICAVGLFAAACSSTTDTTAKGPTVNDTEAPLPPKPGGRLVFGVAGESDGFLPQANRYGPSAMEIGRAVFDPLATIGKDGKMHPYLASSIEPTKPDYTEWQIKARPTLFHNGEKFDADALLLNIQTFRESALTTTALAPITGVTKVDDQSIKITTNVSWANFPSVFATQVGFVAAPAEIKANDGAKPIGTGPFVYASWSPGAPFKATKNEQYWQPGLPYLDAVEFRPIADPDSRRKALESEDIDVAHTNTTSDLMRIVKDDDPPRGTKVMLDEGEGDEYTVVLNTQTGLFTDKNLRIALAKATDKKGIVSGQFDDFYETADGPYADKSFWHSPSGSPEYDLDGAKKLIADYANAHGGTPPTFTYTTISTPEDQLVAQVLEQQWTEAGFKVTLESQDEAKFSATIVFGKYDSFGFKYYNSADPDSDYYFWSNENVGPPGGISLNFPRYASAAQQQGLLDGRKEADPQKRKEAYAKVWKDWGENVPLIFVFHAKWAMIYNTRVHNLGYNVAPDGAAIPPIMWGAGFLTQTWIDQ